MTFQKFPFLPVVVYLYDRVFFSLFIFGILFCYFQLFFVKSYKNMLTISSIESFNWVCIILFLSLFSGFVFVVIYFIFFFFILDYSGAKNVNFYNWEVVFVFINFPFTITFFIKIFSLISCFENYYFILLLVLLLMFISVFSFGI